MPPVVLRDIVTDDDRSAVLAVRRRPGQERFVGSVEDSFADAIEDAHAMPRMWSVHDAGTGGVVGFAMISDGIPAETLASRDVIGPYYLWRLLIDAGQQGKGYGAATLDAIVDYLQGRPGAETLFTSCGQGEGSPQPFYERYGFVPTGEIKWDEVVLRLDLHQEDR